MVWQDYVIAVAQIGFVIALIPTLRSKNKPPVATSFMTVVLLTVISFCMLTLHLYFSAITALAIDITWLTIGIQTLKAGKKMK
ncbi:MAG TPA: hypothetical protein VFX84_03965 [Candidatus Saccharimonadales bacterium]|nr:hypothetical protein [Candidatus Saccharimonadales bacterium]